MKIVLQRVKNASVRVGAETVASIGCGLLLLVAAEKGDTEEDLPYFVEKTVNLRIFLDKNLKMNLSIKDIGGEILLVSQFTLAGSVRRGRRPSFGRALDKDEAEPLLGTFADLLRAGGVNVSTGVFGAMMEVALVNDGPVTILLESPRSDGEP